MNVVKIRTGMVAVALAAALSIGLAAPAPSHAGCLTEFDACGDCANKMLIAAIRNRDLGDLGDAYLYGLDCEIDLLHCLLYAKNHTYTCSV